MLSADHGQPEIPGHLRQLGIEHARHFDTDALDKTPAIAALKERFGIAEELIEAFFQPYVYLNRELIRARGLDQAEVEKAKTVSRPVTPYDVAPTLANYLGVKPPSGAIGNPLTEVVGN